MGRNKGETTIYAASKREDGTHVVSVALTHEMHADELRDKLQVIVRYADTLSYKTHPRPKPEDKTLRTGARSRWHIAAKDVENIEAHPDEPIQFFELIETPGWYAII